MVPGQVAAIRLVSRLCHPEWVKERGNGASRGVLVGTITFFDSSRTTRISHHLDNPAPAGWCEMPSAQTRWTSGNALLLLGEQESLNPGVLSIEILSDETYHMEDAATPDIKQLS